MTYILREDKHEALSENLGKALRYLGRAMTCIEELESDGSEMGERVFGRYGNRYGMRERYPELDEMGERRARYRY